MRAVEDVDEGQLEESGLQIPERDVHGRERHEPHPRPPDVSQRRGHCLPGRAHCHRIPPLDDLGKLALHETGDGLVPVGVAQTGATTRLDFDDDDRRRIPHERPIGLLAVRPVGRDGESLGGNPLD